jgi:hypothetical protein
MCLFLEINIIEISWKVVRKSWHWSWLGDIRPFSSIFRALGRSRHPLYMVKVNCIQLIEHVGNNLDYVGSHVLIGVPQDCLVAPFRMSIYIYMYNYIYMHVLFGFISKPWSNVFKMVASLCVIVIARQFFIDSPDMIPSTKQILLETSWNPNDPYYFRDLTHTLLVEHGGFFGIQMWGFHSRNVARCHVLPGNIGERSNTFNAGMFIGQLVDDFMFTYGFVWK